MTLVGEIEELVESYRSWLKQKTVVRDINGSWVEITTPYLDRHNDALQIYAQQANDGYLLSDDSYTIHDLEASGCSLSSAKRQDLLNMTLKGFGVKLHEEALEIHATKDSFPLRKHNLIQAMLAVNDLFYLAKPMVESLFLEDVTAWLDSVEVRYTPKVKFTGKSGFDHLFDFVIPKSRRAPERVIQAINKPAKNTTEQLIFSWDDTRDVRSPEAKAYAMLNDTEESLSPSVTDALKNYGIQPIPWSSRFSVAEQLAA
jgi:hypothetical protein